METVLRNISSLLWIALAIMTFFGLRKWNKNFSELYEELKKDFEDGDDND